MNISTTASASRIDASSTLNPALPTATQSSYVAPSILPTNNSSSTAAPSIYDKSSTLSTSTHANDAATSSEKKTSASKPYIQTISTTVETTTTTVELTTKTTRPSSLSAANGCRKREAEDGECVTNAECVRDGSTYLCKCMKGFTNKSSTCQQDISWGQNRGTSVRSFVSHAVMIINACVHLMSTIP
ncbi:hypothetical protein DPMN_179662 [Dreissena polymorpha]|uniref:EGF-like domain-containing protein n=3 Tax=Dreissena polymorpha TaxID=45954 RepID=A0A9D4EEG2_DREPO|nr:hypothetical protein DPMN_179662 [Dreissena polymorpha]